MFLLTLRLQEQLLNSTSGPHLHISDGSTDTNSNNSVLLQVFMKTNEHEGTRKNMEERKGTWRNAKEHEGKCLTLSDVNWGQSRSLRGTRKGSFGHAHLQHVHVSVVHDGKWAEELQVEEEEEEATYREWRCYHVSLCVPLGRWADRWMEILWCFFLFPVEVLELVAEGSALL